MRISDLSSDVCSSDLLYRRRASLRGRHHHLPRRRLVSLHGRTVITASHPGKIATAIATSLILDEVGIYSVQSSLSTHRFDRRPRQRSEEHTSELQSLMRISYAVFCLTTH